MENLIVNPTATTQSSDPVGPQETNAKPTNNGSPGSHRPLSPRDKILYGLAALCILSSNIAVYIGLLLPPEGEIHSSILMFFGLVCAFSGTMFGISADFRSTLLSLRTETPSTKSR